MSARGQWTIVLVVVALLGFAAWAAVHFYGDDIFPVEVGSAAPEFNAHRLHSAQQVSLDTYKGQVLLINVWATWCTTRRSRSRRTIKSRGIPPRSWWTGRV